MRNAYLISAAAAAMWSPGTAGAQRTDDNAATSAEDAFGSSVGDSSIGIYSEGDVRGFSPAVAGNLRIHGLYYDQQGTLTPRLLAGSMIRVGISAQSYLFPAPTGIADYSLRRPGGGAQASIGLTYGPRGGALAELDVKLPLDGDRLGIAVGADINRGRRSYAGTPEMATVAALLRYAPRDRMEFLAFHSRLRVTDDESQPFIFSSGDFLPKRIRRNRFFGQKWNDYSYTIGTYGLIANADLAGFDLRFGLFRSSFDNDVATADLLLGTDRDGSVAQRVIFRERDDYFASTSGELRFTRNFEEGPRRHSIVASARARRLSRLYGGGALIDLGASRSDAPDTRPEPESSDGPKNRDKVRQNIWGIAYQGRWRDVGELSVGLQRTNYLKRVVTPDPVAILPETRATPWLPTANSAIYATPSLAFYAGYARGLEESPVAPIDAVNRNEAPPAILTRQIDGGLRWAITPSLTAVAGLFKITKPYFSVDEDGRFRQLGAVTNRGAEFSLAGKLAPGLNLVAGTVLLDARISGEEVAAGTIGRRPVASFARRTLVSLDYRPPSLDRLSVDFLVDSSSKRVANRTNSFFVPARTIVNLGGRYRFQLAKSPALVRVQVSNLFNKFGWNIAGSGYFTAIAARTFTLSLAVDFQ